MSKHKEEIITRTKDQHLKILCPSIVCSIALISTMDLSILWMWNPNQAC